MTDRRIRKTKGAIKKTLLKQMLALKYNELSVLAVCEEADISRRTFYLHYQDIDHVFRDIFDEINAPLYQGIEELEKEYRHGENEDYELGEIFRLINETIKNHTAYLTRIAAEPSYAGIQMRHIILLKNLIRKHFRNTDESGIRAVYLDYYISGILELYFQWYRHEHDLSLDDIRQFALDILRADRTYFISRYEKKN